MRHIRVRNEARLRRMKRALRRMKHAFGRIEVCRGSRHILM